mgnify:CR=1 FL=1
MRIIKKIVGFIIYKFTPIKKGVFVFSSFGGHYSDNPKYISMELYNSYPDIKQVWLLKKEYYENTPTYITKVDIDSLDAFYWRGKAEVIIDNVYGGREISVTEYSLVSKIKIRLLMLLTNKKKQPVVTNFHGSAFKYAGRDIIGTNQKNFICPNTYLLLQNDFSCNVYEHLTFGNVPIQLIGYPRNDILFDSSVDKYKLKEKLGISPNKKVILLAPTFRSDSQDGLGEKNIYRSGINQLNSFDFPSLFATLQSKFGGEWTLVCRFHYHVEKMIDWNKIYDKYDGQITRGNLGDDMAEYLAISDILLTDASSSMFDFAVTNRPCILYFLDWKEYGSKERGFYIPIEELPFPLASNYTELQRILWNWKEDEYKTKIENMKERLGYVDDGNAAKKNVDYIIGKKWINAKKGYKKME